MPVKKKAPKKKVVKKKPLKRKAVRKPAAKKPAAKRKTVKKVAVSKKASEGVVVGTITHYFPHVRAAVIKLKKPLAVGDTIKIKGHTTDFTEHITSMQIDRVAVNSAKKGQEIGLLVESRVRQHDVVYRV